MFLIIVSHVSLNNPFSISTILFAYPMSPAVNHPAGVTFVDDYSPRSVDVDPATYYRDEIHSRSRTYSHVGFAYSTL